MNKKLYIGYDENINDFRIGTLEELNSFDSIEIKDLLEDVEINDIIEFIQDEVNMATVLKVKIEIEFIKDLEEINLTIEKLAGGERKVKIEVEDWISEIIDFIQDELNMAAVLKVKINKFEFIKDLEEINLTTEKLAGGEREIELEVEDWITEITTREIINKLENKLIESFGDMIEIK